MAVSSAVRRSSGMTVLPSEAEITNGLTIATTVPEASMTLPDSSKV